jgi:hypothetical protein
MNNNFFILFDIEDDTDIFSCSCSFCFSFLSCLIKEKYDSSFTDEILFLPKLFSFSNSIELISGFIPEFFFFIKF